MVTFKKIDALLREMEALNSRGLALTLFYGACSALLFVRLILDGPVDISGRGLLAIVAVFVLTRIYERRRDRRFKEVNAELTKLMDQARVEAGLEETKEK